MQWRRRVRCATRWWRAGSSSRPATRTATGRRGRRLARTASTCSTGASHPVIVYDRDGTFPALLGRGRVHRPHARHHHRPGRQRLLRGRRRPDRAQVHPRGQAAADARHAGSRPTPATTARTRRRSRGPAARSTGRPTWPSAPNGDIYVSDGYGNARVHRFSPAASCCSPGASPAPGRASSTCRTDRGRRRRARLGLRPRERPHPDLQPGRRVPRASGRTCSAPPTWPSTRRAGLRHRAVVAGGPALDGKGAITRSRPARVSVHDPEGKRAGPLGQRRPLRPGQLRRPPRHRRGLAGRRLRAPR